MDVHSCEVNWAPLSDDRYIGKFSQTGNPVGYEALGHRWCWGMASGQRENGSTIVNK